MNWKTFTPNQWAAFTANDWAKFGIEAAEIAFHFAVIEKGFADAASFQVVQQVGSTTHSEAADARFMVRAVQISATGKFEDRGNQDAMPTYRCR